MIIRKIQFLYGTFIKQFFVPLIFALLPISIIVGALLNFLLLELINRSAISTALFTSLIINTGYSQTIC